MITIDLETKSYCELKKTGAAVYSEHPTTDILCVCWADDQSDKIYSWWPGMNLGAQWGSDDLVVVNQIPFSLRKAIEDGELFEAHNYAFEYSIWKNVLAKKYGWPEPPLHKWRDTMAVAAYYSMPRQLAKLAEALNGPLKDAAGTRLLSKYSFLHLKTATEDLPFEKLMEIVKYCEGDVRAEKWISSYLGDLPPRELPLFLLDQIVNTRGLFLDGEGIAAATMLVEDRSAELTKEFNGIVGLNPTQREKVLEWFAARGWKLDNMQADYLTDEYEARAKFAPETNPLMRAMQIRLQVNKASTKKLDAMQRQTSGNGRALFQATYHGAGTGRDTGAGFQPLNLSKGFEDMDPDQLTSDIMMLNPGYLDTVYGSVVEACGKASRNWIMAEPGHKLVAGDYSSIEAVCLACLAGEEWKVEAFRAGVDIYCLSAEKIYKLEPGTVTKKTHPLERDDGKKCELAFGYQGALKAWRKFDKTDRHDDKSVLKINKAWRLEHPATTQWWADLDEAAILAVKNPGQTFYARLVGFQIVDEWLTMILPDGKRLWYRDPELRMNMPSWHQPTEDPKCAEGLCWCQPRESLCYMSWKEGQWKRVYTYGGKLAENATQAVSRQILAPHLLAVEAAGYSIILKVYDEIVTEVPENFGSPEELAAIMMEPLDWCRYWPIKVSPWEGRRYRK